MTDDFKVDGRSTKEIASITLAWRDTLGVADQWAPSVVSLLELRLPRIVKNFALVVRSDTEMGDAEAYRAPRTMTILLLEISPLWHDARFHC